MPDDNQTDPLTTDIAQQVIEAAVKSVERRTGGVEVVVEPQAPAAPPVIGAPSEGDGAEVRALKDELFKSRQALRQREAELEKIIREKDAQLEMSTQMGRETLEKLKDQHERMLRAAADLDNYKKRAVKERDEALRFGQEKLLREMLPVVDNLERALEHAKSPADFDGLKTGIQMTQKLMETGLGKFGVKPFSALNVPFDPHLHEAMQSVESDAAPNTVVQELVRGYTLHDRLMRPAMVVVAKPRQAPPPAPVEQAKAEAAQTSATPVAPAGGPADEAADKPASPGDAQGNS